MPVAGKQHAHDGDRQLALAAVKSRRDRVDEQRRREHADEHEHGDEQAQHRQNGASDAVGLAPLAARDQRRIDGDERS